MSISSEITRIQNKRDLSFAEVENKGVTVPAGSTIDDLPGLIAQIEQGSGSSSGGIIYQDLDGYLNLSEEEANVISIVDTLDTAGGTVRTITGAVESGGGYTLADIATGAEPSGAVDLTGIVTNNYAFRARPNITSAYGVLGTNAHVTGLFQQCTALTKAYIEMSNYPQGTDGIFQQCTALTTAVFLTSGTNQMQGVFNGCTNLVTADIAVSRLRNNTFASCTKLATLILRGTTITLLESVGALNASSFKSGGAGGTIYIPKVLYDHLGDGTSLDYKAATNWSTFDGYGTITWAQIEGSIYETQYADGTPIT